MGESRRIEFELDEGRHDELRVEADRLGLSTEELAKRAVCVWLRDMAEEEPTAGI